jgi:cytochrome c-type biogenesis protein CcmE
MPQNNKVLITVTGITIVALFWIYWVSVNPMDEKAMVKFISVQEILKTVNNERVRIGGIVADGSIAISSTNKLEVAFTLKEGNSLLPVEFIGTRPDLFKNGAEVIVEGLYQDGSFHADILQTKCASRYEGDLRNASYYNLDEIEI